MPGNTFIHLLVFVRNFNRSSFQFCQNLRCRTVILATCIYLHHPFDRPEQIDRRRSGSLQLCCNFRQLRSQISLITHSFGGPQHQPESSRCTDSRRAAHFQPADRFGHPPVVPALNILFLQRQLGLVQQHQCPVLPQHRLQPRFTAGHSLKPPNSCNA